MEKEGRDCDGGGCWRDEDNDGVRRVKKKWGKKGKTSKKMLHEHILNGRKWKGSSKAWIRKWYGAKSLQEKGKLLSYASNWFMRSRKSSQFHKMQKDSWQPCTSRTLPPLYTSIHVHAFRQSHTGGQWQRQSRLSAWRRLQPNERARCHSIQYAFFLTHAGVDAKLEMWKRRGSLLRVHEICMVELFSHLCRGSSA